MRIGMAVGQFGHRAVPFVFVVPHADAAFFDGAAADVVHGFGDRQKMLEEFAWRCFRRRNRAATSSSAMRIMFRQYMAIQPVLSAWASCGAHRQRRVAVEHGDVVQAQEAAVEDVAILRVLAIDPPGEIQQQFVEHSLQEFAIAVMAVAACDRFDKLARRPRRAPAD